MAIFRRNDQIKIEAVMHIMDMFSYDGVVYYLACMKDPTDFVSCSILDIPFLLLCTDSSVEKISDEVVEYARLWVADKFGHD